MCEAHFVPEIFNKKAANIQYVQMNCQLSPMYEDLRQGDELYLIVAADIVYIYPQKRFCLSEELHPMLLKNDDGEN